MSKEDSSASNEKQWKDYGKGECIVPACKHYRIYDYVHERYMPVCGYDCFHVAVKQGLI